MEDDLSLGLCIIKVLCLIVIAMSAHRIAYSNEYLVGGNGLYGNGLLSGQSPGYGTSSGLRYAQEREQSMFNNAEPPVFYNLGDAETIASELNAAAAAGPAQSSFGNRSYASGINENKLENILRAA